MSTSGNCANSPRCSARKSLIVRCAGVLPAASTRKAMSSCSFRASFRDENTPVAYPYTSTLTIIDGWYG